MVTAFGAAVVAVMFLSYWLEPRSRWFVAVFVVASAYTYAWLIESYPLFVIEGLWSLVAFRQFWLRQQLESKMAPAVARVHAS